ncbi:hypothetical protein M8998_04080 [Sphingobacterium sp. lm-10]|uniref:hypothetical protein n=1 Tax=Sphingobacterium sp. lm-10 TaxID=2944904 RepID=UPI002021E3B0|nr:hypothetical protein [Sphingobacterium sp. lm-10]MCL7987117.1 hypothetical protein [Sphingobacterium sp. lm-10]
MLTAQLIKDYLGTHAVARKLEDKHREMLRKIFFSLIGENDTDSFLRVSELVAYCSQELKDEVWPEPAIARIANKALATLLAQRIPKELNVRSAI